MKLVVGLGNPGEKYPLTRHNAGFMVIDEIVRHYVAGPHFNKKFEAIVYNLDQDNILIKPQTFMNLSGKAVNRLVNFYKIKPQDLLVVHDDIDLDFGEIKDQFGRGSAGHNGVESVIKALGSDQFERVRVGIGRPTAGVGVEDYVLQKFSEDENDVHKLIERAAEVVVNWLKEKPPKN